MGGIGGLAKATGIGLAISLLGSQLFKKKTALGKLFRIFSDERLKKNIVTINSGLDKVASMRGVTYTHRVTDEERVGVIAQELKEIIPELIDEDDRGYLSVSYTGIVPVLIEAIKELKQEVETLKSKVG